MADENTNNNVGAIEDPTTGATNSKSPVVNGAVEVYVDEVLTTIPIAAGMVGCFSNTTYTINDTGLLKNKSNSPSSNAFKWSCIIGGKEYVFNNTGHCVEDPAGVETHHLYIVASSIKVAEGNKVTGITRSGTIDAKTVSVDSITVRDQFALGALEALIHKMDNPLECSTAACKYVTDKAYEFANAMMISSVEARVQYEESSGSGGTEGTVDVPEGDLANNTEKLLNNIYKVLEAQKNQDQTQFEIGVKIASAPTVLVDNPEDEQHEVDKFQIEGGGGGNSMSYDDLPLLTETGQTTMTHVLGFATDTEDKKYIGKLGFVDFCAKVWTNIKNNIWNYIKNDVDSEITSVGNTNLDSNGNWRSTIESIADSRITAKVKPESLNP